jgi:hypothetical protein
LLIASRKVAERDDGLARGAAVHATRPPARIVSIGKNCGPFAIPLIDEA